MSPAGAQDLPSLELPGAPAPAKGAAGGVELPEAIDISDMVLAAAKQPISVQESPSIITVVTREQILQRGFRTLWDVLQTIPGFEANRYLFTYRYTDVATRGNFNTVLVLWNGISVVDPHDGATPMDQRLPLDAVDRIEVTSGPGGVLWGANAYLGVINIVTRDGSSFRGVEGQAGYGTGPGAPNAFKASVSIAERFFKGKLKFFLNFNFYTAANEEYPIQADTLLPPLNSPSPDGALQYRVPIMPVYTPRVYYAAATGNIGYGPVQVDWHIPFNRWFRPLSNTMTRSDDPRIWRDGVAQPALTSCFFDTTPGATCYDMHVYQRASGDWHMVSARYQDNFLENKIGVTARTYWTGFLNVSTQSTYIPAGGVWNASYTGNDFFRSQAPYPHDYFGESYFTDQYRIGGTVDVTAQLPFRNRAIAGAEVFQEHSAAKYQLLCNGDNALACVANNAPVNTVRLPDGTMVPANSLAGYPASRIVIGAFLHDEWRPIPKLALSAGVRFQHLRLDVDYTAPFSIFPDNTPVPGTSGTEHLRNNLNVVLASAAGTYNIWKKTHVKVNFAQGFRPPRLFDLDAPINAGAAAYPGNPNLGVENSYAIEGEINTLLLERHKGIRKLYLRGDYSYSTISNLIVRPQLVAQNAGTRYAHSAEFALFLEGMKGWNFWLTYYYVDLVDADAGPIRNIARQKLNLGGALKLFDGKLELSTVLSVVGSTDDLNRQFIADTAHETLSFPGAYVTTPTMLRIDRYPVLPLWRVGAWIRNVVPKTDFSIFVDNLLDVRYHIADADFQARQAPMPIPMPGLTLMVSAWVKI